MILFTVWANAYNVQNILWRSDDARKAFIGGKDLLRSASIESKPFTMYLASLDGYIELPDPLTADLSSGNVKCPQCEGAGTTYFFKDRCPIEGRKMQSPRDCSVCEGEGFIFARNGEAAAFSLLGAFKDFFAKVVDAQNKLEKKSKDNSRQVALNKLTKEDRKLLGLDEPLSTISAPVEV